MIEEYAKALSQYIVGKDESSEKRDRQQFMNRVVSVHTRASELANMVIERKYGTGFKSNLTKIFYTSVVAFTVTNRILDREREKNNFPKKDFLLY